MRFLILLMVCWGIGFSQANAEQLPPLEAFAGQQQVSLVRISPDGKLLAFLNIRNGTPYILIKPLQGPVSSVINIDGVKPGNISWAGNEHLLITVHVTDTDERFRQEHEKVEYLRTFATNIKTGKHVQLLLKSSRRLWKFGSYVGGVLAIDHEKPSAFIPARGRDGQWNVYEVNLATGRGKSRFHGVKKGQSWVLSPQNTAIARVIYSQKSNKFTINVREGSNWRTIFERKSELPPVSVIGLNIAQTALVVRMITDTVPFEAFYEMDIVTGEMGKPLFQPTGYDADYTIADPYTNLIVGASWLADQDEYHWFDPQLASVYTQLKENFPTQAVRLTSWSQDRTKFIVAMAEPGHPGQYFIFYPDTSALSPISSSRPALAKVQLGQVTPYTYMAKDGLLIHAYLTVPPNAQNRNLPLVVFPHGGPEARDSANFDWWAQLLTSRGYAVFQPNFRGSGGYGRAFTKAGWGEWGQAMQDDVTDGVHDLIAKGTVDPNRICIAGSSYGGYAALAGGAFTPELYQCVISIAGISNLREWFDWNKDRFGHEHWVITYLERSMSADEKRDIAMKAASPIHFTDQFKAPVLLIHGKDDTVVPVQQSHRMNRALKRANADVRLIIQDNADHWMSFEETRLETAAEMLKFLDEHIGE